MNRGLYQEIRKSLNFHKDGWQLAQYLLTDVILYAVVAGLFLRNDLWTLLSIPCVSVLMFRNFSLMHDASHGGLTKNKFLRATLGLLSGIVCLLPYDLWKKSHLKHHFWAGNYEQDPVLMIVKKFPNSSDASKKMFNFFWQKGIPFAGLSQNIVFWINATIDWKGNIASVKSWIDFWIPVVAWGWLLSSLTSGYQVAALGAGFYCYLRLVEIINFPHHAGLYVQPLGENHLPASDQFEVTRTCVYQSWFEKFILLNFNYHAAHHLFPDLPWHELEKAHQTLMKSELGKSMIVVSGDWIYEQQRRPFAEFLFPHEEREEKKKEAA